MSKNRFPDYNPEKRNDLVFVISDKCFDDSKIPVIVKDHNDINIFVDELQKFCQSKGFEIDSFGTKQAMIERFATIKQGHTT